MARSVALKVARGALPPISPLRPFYSPNIITGDRETGVGDWSDEELIVAIRDGPARVGVEAPVTPYHQYAGMTDSDAEDLVAYRRTWPQCVAKTPRRR